MPDPLRGEGWDRSTSLCTHRSQIFASFISYWHRRDGNQACGTFFDPLWSARVCTTTTGMAYNSPRCSIYIQLSRNLMSSSRGGGPDTCLTTRPLSDEWSIILVLEVSLPLDVRLSSASVYLVSSLSQACCFLCPVSNLPFCMSMSWSALGISSAT